MTPWARVKLRDVLKAYKAVTHGTRSHSCSNQDPGHHAPVSSATQRTRSMPCRHVGFTPLLPEVGHFLFLRLWLCIFVYLLVSVCCLHVRPILYLSASSFRNRCLIIKAPYELVTVFLLFSLLEIGKTRKGLDDNWWQNPECWPLGSAHDAQYHSNSAILMGR